MSLPTIQQAFNAGEIAPELYGQVSLAKYAAALTTARNVFVNYRGGAMSRGGLAFIGRCKQAVTGTGPPRPIPFQFSNNQGYVLEFGDNYLRFVFQGGYVVETAVAITGATKANPCQINVSGTPYANGDWIFISGVGGMTQLNGQTFIVAGVASGHFTLQDLNGNPVNSTAYGTYTSGGTCSRIYTISTPYAAVDLPYLKFSQTADVMSLTCSNPATGTEYPPYDLTRQGAASWTLQQTSFDDVIAAPTNVGAAANSQAPTSGVNASFAYLVTAVDSNGNESVASTVATCHGADLQVEAGSNTISWSGVSGAAYYNVYRAPVSVDNASPVPVPAGSVFGFVGSAYGTQFSDTVTSPDLTQTPPTHRNPFAEGQIIGVTITGAGSGLQAATYTVTSGAGSGFVGTPIVTNGNLGGFQIVSPGKSYAPGDSIAFNGAGFASGAIKFGTTNPLAGDTITLNGVVWTFVNAVTGSYQTAIGGSLDATLQSLVAGLTASGVSSLAVASYAEDINKQNLLITYKTAGTGGNSYTLAASRATPSGSTLTGGGGSGSGGAAATGSFTFSGNPSNTQTIILNGVTWTFVTSGATGNQTNIQASLSATLTQLASDLNASTNAAISLASYTGTTTRLQISYKTVGAVGNSYTLNAGTAPATPSGSTLSGGADSYTTPTGTLQIGPATGTYPGVNVYFQQRHFFANSLNDPDTLWATQIGRYNSMDTSVPTKATDAITATPWTEQVNGIQWLIPMPGGLIAMTGLRAWQIIGEGSYQLNPQPITPSTTQAQPQAFNGCSSTIPPIVIDYDVLYVQAIGNTTVFDLSWNFWVNIYTGNDLTILSSHLFLYRQIVQWAWARQPYKVLWAACNDGTMISLTYLKEQQVYGWSRHDTNGLVVGVCSVTEPPVNAVYCVVERFPPYAAAGVYFMERMDNRIWQTVEDAYAVDGAVSNPLSYPSASLFASASAGSVIMTAQNGTPFSAASVGQVIRMGGGIATVTIYTSATQVTASWTLSPTSLGASGTPYAPAGAWSIAAPISSIRATHLAGMTGLVGLLDGVPISNLSAGSDGTVTLPFTASNVKVGLGFTAQLQTPYLNGDQVVQGARKAINAVTVRIAASAGFQVGTNQPDGAAQSPPQIAPAWMNMATADLTKPTGGQTGPAQYSATGGPTVTQLWTGDIRVLGQGSAWISKGQVAIQQAQPLPLQVIAIEPEYLPGDIPEVRAQPQQRDPRQPSPGPGLWMIRGGAYDPQG